MERFEVCDRLASNDDGMEQEPEKRLESITVFGVEVRAGIRSKLSPQKSADINGHGVERQGCHR